MPLQWVILLFFFLVFAATEAIVGVRGYCHGQDQCQELAQARRHRHRGACATLHITGLGSLIYEL
jgi:hypothetical protein